MKKLDIDFVIPSRGNHFHGANERIGEIKAHHEKRLNFILDHIYKEITVYQLSQLLFPCIKTTHEIRFAIGENNGLYRILKGKRAM
ncbi:hypothetical protein [Oceanobacillus salinisoli]|uniref:hypothetical protein n=1 Tax=Oceanobacillus salinisoli TaxID=2678611 RepID=UPI001E3034B5|nr:hypothetical protein [Oceanobacillus salinisoli]